MLSAVCRFLSLQWYKFEQHSHYRLLSQTHTHTHTSSVIHAVCVQVKDLLSLWHRAAAVWHEECNQVASVGASVAAAGTFSLDEADVKFFRQDVAVREAHKKQGGVRAAGAHT